MNGNGYGNSASGSGSTSVQVVLGSMERAEEYAQILTNLKANGGDVQGEMVDRILGGGKSLLDTIPLRLHAPIEYRGGGSLARNEKFG